MRTRCPNCRSRFMSETNDGDRARCRRCGETSSLESATDGRR